ncbi:DUF453 domain-containing protein [Patellaria atrata CBS 101060]|uniref:DUF453 domain-containing protein n=1 Tax=Patellaria atrata CBS 101060 TaxID=1346257 RepID=A0A9P4VNE5_9PEZI|nr:DUF453 domain-containing protein [Patellaria atrata CBS 101060]
MNTASCTSLRITYTPVRSHGPTRLPSTTLRHRQTRHKQHAAAASYYRGGTSRGVIFQPNDLPADESQWPRIFRHVLGGPDPYGRQLDGLGAGISSLSKICLVSPSARKDADIDYTFIGVGIDTPELDTSGNCGNMSAAVGPYAYDKRMLGDSIDYSSKREVTVRIHNTNTGVIIHSIFPVADGTSLPADTEPVSISGVPGTAAKVTLHFLRPGGAKTGKLLPTGNPMDVFSNHCVSCIDATNPSIFIQASSLGIPGPILPNTLIEMPSVLNELEHLRRQGAEAMGLLQADGTPYRSQPKIAMVSKPEEHTTLSGETLPASSVDLVVRFVSDGQPHRAIPLTGALCTAAAAQVPGTVVAELLAEERVMEGIVTLGHPSGMIRVDAVSDGEGGVKTVTVLRTARRIMDGVVYWEDGVRVELPRDVDVST